MRIYGCLLAIALGAYQTYVLASIGAWVPAVFVGVTLLCLGISQWVGDQSISYELSCLIRGIVPLYEHVHALWREPWDCGEEAPDLLESIEPGCRIYWP